MSKTAKHQLEGQESSLEAINALTTLELDRLSFVQLRRLHKILTQACEEVASETERRSESDNSGDTVRVPSPTV